MKATSQMNSNALFTKKRISLPLIVVSLLWLNLKIISHVSDRIDRQEGFK